MCRSYAAPAPQRSGGIGVAPREDVRVRIPRAPAVLLTGHPSSGKSTLAAAVSAALVERRVASEVLDGDELRTRLAPQLGFSPADRSRQFAHALFVAELLAAHAVVPILALVAPFAADRELGATVFAPTGW